MQSPLLRKLPYSAFGLVLVVHQHVTAGTAGKRLQLAVDDGGMSAPLGTLDELLHDVRAVFVERHGQVFSEASKGFRPRVSVTFKRIASHVVAADVVQDCGGLHDHGVLAVGHDFNGLLWALDHMRLWSDTVQLAEQFHEAILCGSVGLGVFYHKGEASHLFMKLSGHLWRWDEGADVRQRLLHETSCLRVFNGGTGTGAGEEDVDVLADS